MTVNSADRNAVILFLTVVFGLAGGALVIPFVDLSTSVWVIVVIGAAVVSTLVAFRLLTADPQPRHFGNETPAPAPAPVVSPAPVPPAQTAGQWWTQPGTPTNNTRAERPAGPTPPLSTYVAKGAALVAQCPNCGDFRVDVSHGEPAYSLRCRNPSCRHEWHWTPGTDWPAVVVRRNLTGEPTGSDRR